MQRIHRTGKTAGFTLLELLIAITVFTIISSITYRGMQTVLDTERHTTEHVQRLSKLQIGMSVIQRDIEQAVARSVRNEYGDSLAPLLGRNLGEIFLEFTRGGYPNPMQLPRSNLQRVGYQLEDGVLYRISWQALDRDQESQPRTSRLIGNIQSLEVVYYDQQMKPGNAWPPTTPSSGSPSAAPLPKAVELIFELEYMGRIRRLFRVAELPVQTT
jgi:general secretion pathway protein J